MRFCIEQTLSGICDHVIPRLGDLGFRVLPVGRTDDGFQVVRVGGLSSQGAVARSRDSIVEHCVPHFAPVVSCFLEGHHTAATANAGRCGLRQVAGTCSCGADFVVRLTSSFAFDLGHRCFLSLPESGASIWCIQPGVFAPACTGLYTQLRTVSKSEQTDTLGFRYQRSAVRIGSGAQRTRPSPVTRVRAESCLGREPVRRRCPAATARRCGERDRAASEPTGPPRSPRRGTSSGRGTNRRPGARRPLRRAG